MGWFTRLCSRIMDGTRGQSTSMDTIRVVIAYSAALSVPRELVTDAARLPYPKPQIKQALIRAIGLATEASMRDELKAAYVRLAEWQEDAAHHAELSERIASESRRLAAEIDALAGDATGGLS